MVPPSHTHNFVPIAVREKGDSCTAYTFRCNDRLVENEAGELAERHPGCGLEEERLFWPNGLPRSIRYRWGGVWFDALDLLRLHPFPVVECDLCRGAVWHPELGLPPCARCGGCGVTTDGDPYADAGVRIAAPKFSG